MSHKIYKMVQRNEIYVSGFQLRARSAYIFINANKSDGVLTEKHLLITLELQSIVMSTSLLTDHAGSGSIL